MQELISKKKKNHEGHMLYSVFSKCIAPILTLKYRELKVTNNTNELRWNWRIEACGRKKERQKERFFFQFVCIFVICNSAFPHFVPLTFSTEIYVTFWRHDWSSQLYTQRLKTVMKLKPEKNIQAWRGTSAIPVQCSTNWAIKLTGSWSLCEFVIYP